jgi:hypothetical protein
LEKTNVEDKKDGQKSVVLVEKHGFEGTLNPQQQISTMREICIRGDLMAGSAQGYLLNGVTMAKSMWLMVRLESLGAMFR